MEKNYIKKKYLENLEQLRGMNPFAYQFLKKLELLNNHYVLILLIFAMKMME